MSHIADIKARLAAKDPRYAALAAGQPAAPAPAPAPARSSVPRSLPLLSECPYQTERLRGCTTCGDYTPEEREGRAVYRCEHPANDAGECTRGNPRSGLWTCASCDHHPSRAADEQKGDR